MPIKKCICTVSVEGKKTHKITLRKEVNFITIKSNKWRVVAGKKAYVQERVLKSF